MSQRTATRKPKMAKKTRRGGRKNAGSSTQALGTIQRSPVLSKGLQVGRSRIPRRSVFSRQVKTRILLSTTGAQTFAIFTIYIYTPLQTTSVNAGTVTVNTGTNAVLTDLMAAFQFYRVRIIQLEYESAVSSTVAVSPALFTLQPSNNPTNIGNTNASYAIQNGIQNSKLLDLHYSTSLGYLIPKPTELTDNQGTTEFVVLKGGWIPTAYFSTARSGADNGIITIHIGDSLLAAPATTNFGVLNICYDIDFLLPE